MSESLPEETVDLSDPISDEDMTHLFWSDLWFDLRDYDIEVEVETEY